MRYVFTMCMLFFCLHLAAQEKHFVFIQSDNSLPFYVSLNGKLYSSSGSGYLIIPKLADGEYKFLVGFAKNEFPEQSFATVINKKDVGYNLKNFGDKGWGLFNLQTLEVMMAGTGSGSEVAKAVSASAATKPDGEAPISFDKPKKDTAATIAVTTTTDTVPKPVAVANDTETKASTTLTEQKATTDTTTVVKAEKTVEPAVGNNTVKKVSETKGDEGVYLSYVDSSGKTTDTIQVIIPSAPASAAPKVESEAVKADTVSTEKTAQPASVTNTGGVKFLDIDMGNTKKDTTEKAAVSDNTIAATAAAGNCKNIATDEDYAKLRKKMAMETSDEKMISEAKKFYKNKCFTTSQIKRLSSLFLSDEGRYNFFAASYVSVADAVQYASLQSEFIDPAFVARFKTMLQ